MKKVLLGLAVSLVMASPAWAKELAGVKMADSMSLEGKELKLNGIGLRTKVFFKVYVAGLYVETPNKDGAALISSDQVKHISLKMLRDLDKGKITEAIREGFDKNSKAQLPALKERLDKLLASINDLKSGQSLNITYVPAKGVTLGGDAGKLTIEGKDFADALFAVWLGSNPVEADLKKGLLGG